MSAAVSLPIEIPVRDAVVEDRAYVLDSWFRTSEGEYFDELRKRFRARISSQASRSKVYVAHDPQDENTILGFAIVEGTTLHYVYVRGGVRKLGIARKLLSSLTIDSYSSATRAFRSRIKPAERGWKDLSEKIE